MIFCSTSATNAEISFLDAPEGAFNINLCNSGEAIIFSVAALARLE